MGRGKGSLEDAPRRTNEQRLRKSNNFVLISGNLTSWGRRKTAVLDLDCNAMCLQEPRLSNKTIPSAKRLATIKGWNLEPGAPCATVRAKTTRTKGRGDNKRKVETTIETTRQGGTAILIKKPQPYLLPGLKAGIPRQLHDTTRWMRVAVALGGKGEHRFFHIIDLYNLSGITSTLVHTQRDRLFQWALEDAAALGNQPVAICCDGNTNPDKALPSRQLSPRDGGRTRHASTDKNHKTRIL